MTAPLLRSFTDKRLPMLNIRSRDFSIDNADGCWAGHEGVALSSDCVSGSSLNQQAMGTVRMRVMMVMETGALLSGTRLHCYYIRHALRASLCDRQPGSLHFVCFCQFIIVGERSDVTFATHQEVRSVSLHLVPLALTLTNENHSFMFVAMIIPCTL